MVFRQKKLAVLMAALCAQALPALAQQATGTSDAGQIDIVGAGDRLGAGLMQAEDTPKARSSVSRSAIDKARGSANPFQLIDVLPGVFSFSNDATGMVGGALTIRGFNADQLGFTVNGAPVNDSGNYAVYPQEMIDPENLCELFVTQGSADSDAPHVGASGGNVGLAACGPEDKRGGRISQTLGDNSFRRTFVRLDTGLMGPLKAYVSYSKGDADKFRGKGKADKEHLDAGFALDLGPGNSISGSMLYNVTVNNNYRAISQAQFQAFGRSFDYFDTWVGNPTPVAGTVQSASFSQTGGTATPTGANSGYWGLSINPFRNALYTLKGNFQITPNTRVDIEPYFWYGYGTGGLQEVVLNETKLLNKATGTLTAATDINGDGDKIDTGVLAYRGSTTRTFRPGATFRLTTQLDNHKLMMGLWYERARHRQQAPATTIDANGVPADLWLQGNLILRPDGTPYENRDVMTISTGSELFIQDSIGLMNDRLNLVLGVRRPEIKRDFYNYASEGSGANAYYEIHNTYDKVLPSVAVKYQLREADHLFFNVTENFKSPGNFTYFSLYNATTQTVATPPVVPETSTNYDFGYRYRGGDVVLSATGFYIDYKQRIAQGYDPLANLTTQTNVGPVSVRGAEFEVGTTLKHGWSTYGSLSFTNSRIEADMPSQKVGDPVHATTGNQFPGTPRWLGALVLQYANGPFYVQAKGKYTGKMYTTFMNDESVSGVSVVDLAAGYRLPDTGFLKRLTFRLNVSNLFDKSYLNPSLGSGSSIVMNATGLNAGTVYYYVGAPRFTSVSVSSEF